MEILAERLKFVRSMRDVTQETVAAALGITVRTYIRYEGGEREPQASIVAALARYYGVSADYLLGLKDER